MVFKINLSHKGKTLKLETDNENLIDKTIGETISGIDISEDLDGYEIQITGTSDKAGLPGLPEEQGPRLRRVLLTKGRGMWDKRKGVRLRKTVRGNVISLDTVQINSKVIKEGKKKFADLSKKEEKAAQTN